MSRKAGSSPHWIRPPRHSGLGYAIAPGTPSGEAYRHGHRPEDVPRANPGHRPRGAVIEHNHGPVGGQVVLHERRVRLGQPAPLDAEVAHPLSHQDVLQLIVHVVQHDVGIAVQQRWRDGTTELHRMVRAVSIADPRDRHQHGVGQPGHLHRRGR